MITKGLLIFVLLISILPAQLFAQGQATAEKAERAYQQKDYSTSAQLYIQAIAEGERSASTYYNAACSLALAGKKDEAFLHLQEAVKGGWVNTNHLKQDTDLNSLHSDSRWQPLVENCAAQEKRQKAFWEGAALKTPFRENLSEDEKIAGLSRFWSEVKFNFANFDLVQGLDWDKLYLDYLPRVRQTQSTFEYYRVLMEMCAKLKDGHTNVYAPAELADETYARPAIATRLIEGKIIVRRVMDEKLAQDGIVQGLEITEINGQPAKQYADERVAPFQSASTKQDLEVRAFDYFLFSGSIREPLVLTFADADGKQLKRTLTRLSLKDRAKLIPNAPLTEFKVLPGNIGLLSLNGFDNDQSVKLFEAAYPEIEKTDALIIDIRNNGGGNSGFGYRILSYLTDQPFQTSKWQTRSYRPAYRAWGTPDDWYRSEAGKSNPIGSKLYSKPVVVLTSPRTYSAAEDFAVAFEVMKRGKIIGEATGGSTGQPLFFSLPGGGNARVCTKRDAFPDGREFVGVGVQPDISVLPTLADFRAGRDAVLEAAVLEIKKQLKK
ncbi:MAG: S41 family peptidase [Acidobacteriota bacterium]